MIKISFPCFMLLCVAVFSSCLKKELPVPRHESGNVTTSSVNMDASYKYQVYYSLKNNSVVGQNLKTSWDIGFETSPSGYHVVLNNAKSMFAINTGKSDFLSVSYNDTAGFGASKKWDEASGNLDSTAIGDWRGDSKVFILDRGYNEKGQFLGFEKIQLLSVNDNAYTLHFAALNGTGDTTITITKDTACNLSFLSFSTRQQFQVEPPKADWDIMFSQYTYIFYNEVPITPYLVTGCLLNRYNTQAAQDTANKFPQLTFSDVNNYTLSSDISTIGYQWKTYNGTSYAVNTNYSYIIRSQEGIYYKLRFTGFYDKAGVKGNPTWEYQRL